MFDKLAAVKVYAQRSLQYAGFANLAMLVYLTSKQTQNFLVYAVLGVFVAGIVFYVDKHSIIGVETDFYYEKSSRWRELERKVAFLYESERGRKHG